MWSFTARNGVSAGSGASGHAWWKYSEAPWSMSQSCRCHESRFEFRAVRSTFVTSASNQTTSGGPRRAGRGARDRVERDAARQVVEPDVHADAALQQIADLLVRLVPSERDVDLEPDELRDAQAAARASSPAITSATSAFGPCPAPRNFAT